MKKFAVMATGLSAAVLAGSLMTSASAQTIKIGVIEPLTGPFAASGNYVTNGAKIAADEINAKGGVLGQKIELVIEDNKSNPTEAASVAEKLMVRDKVPVLMGAWGSSLTLAVMPKLMEYKVPMLSRLRRPARSRPPEILTSSAFHRRRLSRRLPSPRSWTSSTSRRPTSWSSTTIGASAR